MIRIKRVYEPLSKKDGFRVLVERLWPRGILKRRAGVDLWLKETAPSPQLRKWFGHDPSRWKKFRERYRAELKRNKDPLELLKRHIRKGTVTFVYAARDKEHNGAVVLKEFLE
jgi:uncharacterized protein YeaO (DUF488 family)